MAESWIIVEIEDGELMIWHGGGEWWSRGKETYISEGGDIDIMCLETPEIKKRMDQRRTFKVKFTGISFIVEEPGWDLNYGFDPGGAWVESDGYEILEVQRV